MERDGTIFRRARLLAGLLAVLNPALGARAQEPGAGASGAGSVPPSAQAAPGAASSGLRVLGSTSNRPGNELSAHLGDRVTVVVNDLSALLESVEGDCQKIVLFLDGIALPGTPAESCNREEGGVRFWLLRSEDNDRQWHSLLGSPTGFTRQVSVSVGSTAEFALPTDVEDFSLVVLPRGPFYVFVVLDIAGLICFLLLARRTNMLRSTVVQPAAGGRPPYSLARSQMAFWFCLVLASYVFIWLITEELDSLSESVLGLIGIGSGTALGAALIDSGRGQASPAQRSASGSFMKDVLEGPTGMSFHRFQMFAWTAVLGVIFCVSVYRTLQMPEFSTTLLALMGISSGTYLGFKFPENQAAGPAGAGPAAGGNEAQPPPAGAG